MAPPKASGSKQGSATGQLGLIKRGAADLKQRLQEASAVEQPMVLLWASANSERACNEAAKNLKRIAASHPGIPALCRVHFSTHANTLSSTCTMVCESFCPTKEDFDLNFAGVAFFEAPVDMSKANAALAAAMGVTHFPCCQIFSSMKVLRSFTDCSAEALSAAIAQCSPDTADAGASSRALGAARPPVEGSTGHAEDSAKGVSADGGLTACGEARRAEETAGSSSSVFDPPAGKEARAGATRMMPGGNTGFFW